MAQASCAQEHDGMSTCQRRGAVHLLARTSFLNLALCAPQYAAGVDPDLHLAVVSDFLLATVVSCSWFLRFAHEYAVMGTWCLCAFPGRSVALRPAVSLLACYCSCFGFCTGICSANPGGDSSLFSGKETRK